MGSSHDPAVASDPKLLGELTDLLALELDRYEDPKQRDDPKQAQYVARMALAHLEAFVTRQSITAPVAAGMRHRIGQLGTAGRA